MSMRLKCLSVIVLCALAWSSSCGQKEAPATGSTAPTSAPTPPPLAPGVSQNLTKNSGAPLYNFDNLGPIQYPAVQKSNQVAADAENAVSGWALDQSKALAGGVDVVIDNVPYAARYGTARTDVADHFKRPDSANSGFL